MDTKICTKCNDEKPLQTFTEYKSGARRNICVLCRKTRDFSQNPERVRSEWVRSGVKERESRRMGDKTGRWILVDSRKADRRKGLQNDLTRDWIDQEIAKGCSYCGESLLRMTLDRIDNSLGHVKSNVVPACIRCNYARGSMPYEAWCCLASGMREARSKGLFGDWVGSCHKKTK